MIQSYSQRGQGGCAVQGLFEECQGWPLFVQRVTGGFIYTEHLLVENKEGCYRDPP
jgi:succinate dehydrogenase/fumarate reductase cytochrome b subunit